MVGDSWRDEFKLEGTNYGICCRGRRARIEGDKSLGKSLISFRAMTRTVGKKGSRVLIELSNTEAGAENLTPVPTFL